MAGIRIEEVDGAPSLVAVETVRFDQADGFVVSQPAANVAKINTSGSPSPDEEARMLAFWDSGEL